jgi:hypothetical protein
MKDSAVSISKNLEIGVPFVSKSFWKPTPKKWRILGDALMTVGSIGTIITIKNPIVAVVCVGLGWLGKVITNSVSEK